MSNHRRKGSVYNRDMNSVTSIIKINPSESRKLSTLSPYIELENGINKNSTLTEPKIPLTIDFKNLKYKNSMRLSGLGKINEISNNPLHSNQQIVNKHKKIDNELSKHSKFLVDSVIKTGKVEKFDELVDNEYKNNENHSNSRLNSSINLKTLREIQTQFMADKQKGQVSISYRNSVGIKKASQNNIDMKNREVYPPIK